MAENWENVNAGGPDSKEGERLASHFDPRQPASLLEAGYHSREEVSQLARRLMKHTGLKEPGRGVRIIGALLCWGVALLGGLCGISLLLDGYLLPIDRDYQNIFFAGSILLGMFLPLVVGVLLARIYRRWLVGLKTREVVLSLATVPSIGRIAARGIFLSWMGTMKRYVLPFFLLGLGSALFLVFVSNQLGHARMSDRAGMLFVVSTLALYVATPLATGASYGLRLLVYVGAVIPLLSPLWMQMVSWLLGPSASGDLVRNAIYLVLLGAHVTCGLSLLVHVAAASSDWNRRFLEMAERA